MYSIGMVAKSVKLADEPEHGNWTVAITDIGKEEAKIFTVKQYGNIFLICQ